MLTSSQRSLRTRPNSLSQKVKARRLFWKLIYLFIVKTLLSTVYLVCHMAALADPPEAKLLYIDFVFIDWGHMGASSHHKFQLHDFHSKMVAIFSTKTMGPNEWAQKGLNKWMGPTGLKWMVPIGLKQMNGPKWAQQSPNHQGSPSHLTAIGVREFNPWHKGV